MWSIWDVRKVSRCSSSNLGLGQVQDLLPHTTSTVSVHHLLGRNWRVSRFLVSLESEFPRANLAEWVSLLQLRAAHGFAGNSHDSWALHHKKFRNNESDTHICRKKELLLMSSEPSDFSCYISHRRTLALNWQQKELLVGGHECSSWHIRRKVYSYISICFHKESK
jgi:hypothetical protein